MNTAAMAQLALAGKPRLVYSLGIRHQSPAAAPRKSSWTSAYSDDSQDSFLFDEELEDADSSSSAPSPTSPMSPRIAHSTSQQTNSGKFTSPYSYSWNHISAPVASMSFSSPLESDDYMQIVRSQTRNAERRVAHQKARRTKTENIFSFQRSSSEADRDDLSDGETLPDLVFDDALLPDSTSLPRTPESSASQYLFSPALLDEKLKAAISPKPILQSLPLVRTKRNVRIPRQETRFSELPDIDQQLERALLFANFTRRGRSRVWEAPEDANEALVQLVDNIQ